MGSERGFRVRTRSTGGVLKEEERVITFTNGSSFSLLWLSWPQGSKLCGELTTRRFDTVHFENVRGLHNQHELVKWEFHLKF